MSDRPPVILRYKAPSLPPGEMWCGVCAMLWLGELSASPVVQEHAQELVKNAMEKNLTEVIVDLRKFHNLTWRTLSLAVSVAPTVRSQFPMATCWEHMQGYKPEFAASADERLINGREKGWENAQEVRTRRRAGG